MASIAHRDKLWYLRRINLFAGVDDGEMRAIADRTTMRAVPH